MQYQTVFDVIDVGYRYWWFPAVFIGFIALIFVELLIRKIIPAWRPSRFRRWSLYSLIGLCALWSVQTFAGTYSDYKELRNALQQGKTVVIEGKVENFIPMPYGGHSMESFVVAGHKFEYSDYNVTAGFNKSSSHGGPIRSGIYVRINAMGLRLRVLKRPNKGSAADNGVVSDAANLRPRTRPEPLCN